MTKEKTLPEEKRHETIVRFLEQAGKHLEKEGVILLLFSSFSKPDVIRKKVKELGYQMKVIGKNKLFFEELFVGELMLLER